MENVNEQKVTAKKVILTSFLVDVSDILLSLVVAILSGSVIMLTQVLEGLSDFASSGLLLWGLKKSDQKADKKHPFGYGREIYFWALISALIMFGITATLSVYFGWQRFVSPYQIHDLHFTFAVLIFTLGTNAYAFWLSLKRLLRKRRVKDIISIFYRSSLVETKATFILDLMGSAASFLGIVALAIYALTGDFRYDGLGAIVIGIVLAIFSYFLILGIRDLLIGRSASPEIELQIRQAALKIPEVKHVLGIKTLHIGPGKLLVNLDVHLESELKTREIERLIDDIKEVIHSEVPSVKHIQVELETPR